MTVHQQYLQSSLVWYRQTRGCSIVVYLLYFACFQLACAPPIFYRGDHLRTEFLVSVLSFSCVSSAANSETGDSCIRPFLAVLVERPRNAGSMVCMLTAGGGVGANYWALWNLWSILSIELLCAGSPGDICWLLCCCVTHLGDIVHVILIAILTLIVSHIISSDYFNARMSHPLGGAIVFFRNRIWRWYGRSRGNRLWTNLLPDEWLHGLLRAHASGEFSDTLGYLFIWLFFLLFWAWYIYSVIMSTYFFISMNWRVSGYRLECQTSFYPRYGCVLHVVRWFSVFV